MHIKTIILAVSLNLILFTHAASIASREPYTEGHSVLSSSLYRKGVLKVKRDVPEVVEPVADLGVSHDDFPRFQKRVVPVGTDKPAGTSNPASGENFVKPFETFTLTELEGLVGSINQDKTLFSN